MIELRYTGNSPSLGLAIFPVTPLEQNASLIWCKKTGRGAFVDPGGNIEDLAKEARQRRIHIEKILITHGHADHCGEAPLLAQLLSVPVEGPHKEDRFWIQQAEKSGPSYGIPRARSFVPDRWLEDGETVSVGDLSLSVLHCPGHTPGHLVFYHKDSALAWVGDVLFRKSIGRTDFPRGDHAQLLSSIRTKLWPLGNETEFVPGHGPLSSFGQERRDNPFVRDRA